jgi:hypothetical protein
MIRAEPMLNLGIADVLHEVHEVSLLGSRTLGAVRARGACKQGTPRAPHAPTARLWTTYNVSPVRTPLLREAGTHYRYGTIATMAGIRTKASGSKKLADRSPTQNSAGSSRPTAGWLRNSPSLSLWTICSQQFAGS